MLVLVAGMPFADSPLSNAVVAAIHAMHCCNGGVSLLPTLAGVLAKNLRTLSTLCADGMIAQVYGHSACCISSVMTNKSSRKRTQDEAVRAQSKQSSMPEAVCRPQHSAHITDNNSLTEHMQL